MEFVFGAQNEDDTVEGIYDRLRVCEGLHPHGMDVL